eukprot:TRINITY_DN24633_c0_g1_i1.p1 TRINITY_DN24633_c0_g1~~TRINITY_DN24633_c0_g1_i1.p1  ORF type:complete len:648 (+),score=159.26 TRINITY_DN24633_c0_g1_i1:57-2000(+)
MDRLRAVVNAENVTNVVLAAAGCYVAGKLLWRVYYAQYDKVVYVTYEDVKDKKYDFIIIGAGSSGSCAAGMLARDARRPRVLLLEAGPPDNYHPMSAQVCPLLTKHNQRSRIDWQYRTAPQAKGCDALAGRESAWPRGKVMGGSSVLNYMMWVRGSRYDYDDWCYKRGCTGWSWKEIVPYYCAIENCSFDVASGDDRACHGFSGLQAIFRKPVAKHCMTTQLFVKACQEQGHPYNDTYNGVSQDGVSYTQYSVDAKGRRMTSFRAYVASLFDRSGKKADIDVLPYAHVSKVLTEKRNGDVRAVGVELWGTHRVELDAARGGEVICSAGAVGSPQILMLSGIGPAEHLREHGIPCVVDVPGVGQNLRDHVFIPVHASIDVEAFKKKHGAGVATGVAGVDMPVLSGFWRYLRGDGAGSVCSTPTTDGMLFMQSSVAKRSGSKTNDLQIVAMLSSRAKGDLRKDSGLDHLNYDKDKMHDVFEPAGPNAHHSAVLLICNNNTKSQGTVTLTSPNYRAAPAIDPKYLSEAEDREVLLEGYEELRRLLKSSAYTDSGYGLQPLARISEDDVGRVTADHSALTIYHPVGTCKMGALQADPMVVCDAELRVRGCENLRVVDASVMPTPPSGNTQAPCYLIGVKGAAMILDGWKAT